MAQSFPFVSVVIPVRNEAGFIEQCLKAVLAQDYPADRMEVIVVDGMSQDETRNLIQNLAKKDPRIYIRDNPRKIAPCAMNIGIVASQGEIIFRVDGHAVIPVDYLRQCVGWLGKENVDGVGGAVDSEATSYLGSVIAAGMSSPFGIGGSGFRTAKEGGGPVVADTLPFWAFRRTVFDRIGLFNEQMVRHQDYELNYRVRKAGGKLLLLPWLRVKYYVRPTLARFWRQYWQYGIWKGRFLRTYPVAVRWRHLIPPLFILAIATAFLLSVLRPGTGLVCLGALIGTYGIFVLVATVTLSARGHLHKAPLLPMVLVSLHVIWGTGVWAGLMMGKIPKN